MHGMNAPGAGRSCSVKFIESTSEWLERLDLKILKAGCASCFGELPLGAKISREMIPECCEFVRRKQVGRCCDRKRRSDLLPCPETKRNSETLVGNNQEPKPHLNSCHSRYLQIPLCSFQGAPYDSPSVLCISPQERVAKHARQRLSTAYHRFKGNIRQPILRCCTFVAKNVLPSNAPNTLHVGWCWIAMPGLSGISGPRAESGKGLGEKSEWSLLLLRFSKSFKIGIWELDGIGRFLWQSLRKAENISPLSRIINQFSRNLSTWLLPKPEAWGHCGQQRLDLHGALQRFGGAGSESQQGRFLRDDPQAWGVRDGVFNVWGFALWKLKKMKFIV